MVTPCEHHAYAVLTFQGFNAEQVYQQLEIDNQPLLEMLQDRVTGLEGV